MDEFEQHLKTMLRTPCRHVIGGVGLVEQCECSMADNFMLNSDGGDCGGIEDIQINNRVAEKGKSKLLESNKPFRVAFAIVKVAVNRTAASSFTSAKLEAIVG